MVNGPVLQNTETGQSYPLGQKGAYLVGRGRDSDFRVEDATVSRQQFRILCESGRYLIEPLAVDNPTYCNGRVLEHKSHLPDGALISFGRSGFQFLAGRLFESSMPTMVGLDASDSGELEGIVKPFPLALETIIGRDEQNAQIVLPHVQVSRRHARIKLHGEQAIITDLKSGNGTFVNGRRLVMPELIRSGDRIGIGPYELVFTGRALEPSSRVDNVQLIGRKLTLDRWDAKKKCWFRTLDEVSVVIRPRELVCLMGPSGAGKTTLLSALSSRERGCQGTVTLNDVDLAKNFDAVKQDLVVVSQRDCLHEFLTPEQALRYTAKLRLPPDTRPDEIEKQVDAMLRMVGLDERRHTPMRVLSGGQRKRASLANELISNPSLIFLDEVTSGLDEESDREMMELFRRIADTGKTVICVTHSTANVERTCDLVVVLAVGGKPAFVGKPSEALQYFHVRRLGDIYNRLAASPDEASQDDPLWSSTSRPLPSARQHSREREREVAPLWQKRFAESRWHKQYVASRMPSEGAVRMVEDAQNGFHWQAWRKVFCHQFPILLSRYAHVAVSDKRALLAIVVQCLVVAILLIQVFGNVGNPGNADPALNTLCSVSWSNNLLFLMAVSCLWFGCNNSAKEIVKEQAIYQKERHVNLQLGSYYASKLVLQCVVAMLQTVTLYYLVSKYTHLPGQFNPQLCLLLATAVAGVAMGLFISAVSTSEEVALTLVPLALIPQIVLSNAIKPLDGLPKTVARFFVTSYWSYGGLRGQLPDSLISQVGIQGFAFKSTLGAIGLQAMIVIVGAVLVLEYRDRGLTRLLSLATKRRKANPEPAK